MDEAEIIAATISDTDRYEELVERYHTGLIIHCERLIGNRDDAEDIAQESFVKAYFNLQQFDPARARYSTWLYKIATNLAIDYLRSRQHQVKVDDIESVAELTMPVHLEEEEKREVREAVRKLRPVEYRQVIEAYYWQGKCYQQIADDTHVPLNTVRTWIRRAKIQLKESLS
jgi:RNA polymerase sigma-70 factor, ECF subfamily